MPAGDWDEQGGFEYLHILCLNWLLIAIARKNSSTGIPTSSASTSIDWNIHS